MINKPLYRVIILPPYSPGVPSLGWGMQKYAARTSSADAPQSPGSRQSERKGRSSQPPFTRAAGLGCREFSQTPSSAYIYVYVVICISGFCGSQPPTTTVSQSPPRHSTPQHIHICIHIYMILIYIYICHIICA